MPPINFEISLQLEWSEKCVSVAGTATNQKSEFEITDTKLYVPVVTLSTKANIKLLKQLESGCKKRIGWNTYQFKNKNQAESRYFDFLIDPSFHGVNSHFFII